MSKNKQCFIISPIGEENSDIRKNSDDLLKLIIIPSLEIFNFDVIRADKIAKPSIITSDILTLVQTAELCIVDLTGGNPNVFYECGRRHEQAKPCIQLIKKGEKIPFDVSGIRTIQYDVTDPHAIRSSIEAIRAYIDSFSDSEFENTTSGASLTTVAQSIDRVERNLLSLVARFSRENSSNSDEISIDKASVTLKSALAPYQAIQEMIASGRVDEASILLEKSKSRLTPHQLIMSCSILSAGGNPLGESLSREILSRKLQLNEDLTDVEFKISLGGLVQYYSSQDREKEGIEKISGIFSSLLKKYSGNNENMGYIYNQMQKIHFGANEYDLAATYGRKAVFLCPNEESYKSNLEKCENMLKRN